MEDTQTTEATPTEQAANGGAPIKSVKVDTTKPCFCSAWQITDPKDATGDSTFTTGCELTTKRMFAQGHDAKLVGFLVEGHFDGYELQRNEGGTLVTYPDPISAAALASEALRGKAEKAVTNRTERDRNRQERADAREQARLERVEKAAAAKEQKAAEKAAAAEAKRAEKAAAPKDVPAQVVEGSQEGDAPASGLARIKVGRREYDAVIEDDGTAKYNDEKTGEERVIERDGYRLLSEASA